MTKEIIRIKNERVLLEYLYKMLSLGYTNGITEEEYFNFIDTLEQRVNSDDSIFAKRIELEYESFETVVEKAMKVLEKSCKSPKQPLLYKEIDGTKMIMPTYDLGKIETSEYKLFTYPKQIKIEKDLFDEIIPKVTLSDYDFIKFENLEGAKKVSAFYISEIAYRYVASKLNQNINVVKSMNIDKYLFGNSEQLLEPNINELFIKAYIHATKIVSKLKDEESIRETIIFSNNPDKPLAHANYLKMVLPEEIKLLSKFSHKTYALNDSEITVKTIREYAKYESSTCIYSDELGYWSDAYVRENGEITDEYVKIMEKRIGNIIY